LRIRRPKEYVEMVNVAPKKPAEKDGLISDVVADSPHKVTHIIGFSLFEFFKEKAVLEIIGHSLAFPLILFSQII